MDKGDSIEDFVQRFTTLTNQFMLVNRTFGYEDLVHKVLRSLIEDWQPKVTQIKESLKMGMLTIQELYGNLKEHKLELKRYKKNGDDEKKKTLALKASNSFDDDENELDQNDLKEGKDEMALLSKRLQRILREKRNKEKRRLQPKRKNINKTEQGGSSNNPNSNNTQPTSFECKKSGQFNLIVQSI